jgi:excisionase family DNA binding protein
VTTAREYLRAEEIARLTGVSLRTVRRWIAAGRLPSAKVVGVRLVAKKAVREMLAPAMREWGKDDPENSDSTNAYNDIGKYSPK